MRTSQYQIVDDMLILNTTISCIHAHITDTLVPTPEILNDLNEHINY